MASPEQKPKKQKENKKPRGGKVAKGDGGAGDSGVPKELDPWPDYIHDRIALWDRYMARYKEELAAKTPEPIKVTLPDGKVFDAQSWRTTPYELAQRISHGLADSTVISKVNGKVWDLDRPLEGDCSLELIKFDSDDGKAVFWHSTAHMMGEAMERFYGGCLCYGPPIKEGFYYDMYLEDQNAKVEDFKDLDGIMKSIAKEKQPFERLELSKEELLDMFAYNKFKVRILDEKVKTDKTTVYRCGPLIDLCLGPHVRHTGKIKAWQVTKASAAYWEGKSDAESLQRIYGISFPDSKQLKEWQKFQEDAAKNDHRRLGREQDLFMFHELSPGSCFFFPQGTHIYRVLIELMRSQYRVRGYSEVMTPNIYNTRLWEQSGHLQHYGEHMFQFECEKENFALKPMNCPGHCLMFNHKPRTHKELPIRYADFGALHRNELSGALSGLTRVRRFQQDDAHIFCRMDQITEEIKGCLDFLRFIYEDVLGFTFRLFLSTRPEEKFLGEIETWNDAEDKLKQALDEFGKHWDLNPGDGAFYGPKIDIMIMDALRREHQCATVQLDFQLPIRFNLEYLDEKGDKRRPVMVHRAVLGSVERMMAVLTESFGGKWPFWISPRQVMIIPVHAAFDDYVREVRDRIFQAGYECEIDLDQSDTMNRKIRNAQLAQYNFILVLGEKEVANQTVNVRTRDNKVRGEMSVEELLERFKVLKENYVRNSEDEF